jgi:hypothetical protein
MAAGKIGAAWFETALTRLLTMRVELFPRHEVKVLAARTRPGNKARNIGGTLRRMDLGRGARPAVHCGKTGAHWSSVTDRPT